MRLPIRTCQCRRMFAVASHGMASIMKKFRLHKTTMCRIEGRALASREEGASLSSTLEIESSVPIDCSDAIDTKYNPSATRLYTMLHGCAVLPRGPRGSWSPPGPAGAALCACVRPASRVVPPCACRVRDRVWRVSVLWRGDGGSPPAPPVCVCVWRRLPYTLPTLPYLYTGPRLSLPHADPQ